MGSLAVLKAGDNRDVLIFSHDTCVQCFENQQNTKVLKVYTLDPVDVSEFRKQGVVLLRCKCKGSCKFLEKSENKSINK